MGIFTVALRAYLQPKSPVIMVTHYEPKRSPESALCTTSKEAVFGMHRKLKASLLAWQGLPVPWDRPSSV